MANRHSSVGISNRIAPEDEARERQNHPAEVEGEAAEPERDEPRPPDVQSATKSGTRASAQKDASTRHTDHTAPASAKVQGAFGKESE
jgi:hypothetical protein